MENMFGPPMDDPLLDKLERSIEEPISPALDAFADPMANLLGAVENSVVSPQPPISHSPFPEPDTSLDILDKLESAIEGSSVNPKPNVGIDPVLPESVSQDNFTTQAKMVGPMSKPPLPPSGETITFGGNRYMGRKSSGGGTGIRFGNDMDWCKYFQKLIWEDSDCCECDNYEPIEEANDDGERPVCRHMQCNY